MNIKQLSLYNFRNFSQVEEIDFPTDALLVAAAPNATGKTNFLESIVMLLRGKSFRASHAECLQWGSESFIIRGVVETSASHTVAIRYHQPTRKLRIEEDGDPASLVTFFSHYPFIVFLPEDTFLFMRGPAQRRNFLNRILVCAPAYVSALVQYQRVLKQRNLLLKNSPNFSETLAWTQLLVEHGNSLWRQRENFIEFINTHLNTTYQKISGEERDFSAKLVASIDVGDDFQKKLEESFQYEQRYGYTMHGPHRDDVEITTNDHPVATVLSQGQMRSLIISLKLISHQYIETVTKQKPLLLLDELLSELDENRQEVLLKNLPVAQTLLTCTAVPKILRERSNVHLLDIRSIISEANFPSTKVEQELPAEPVQA